MSLAPLDSIEHFMSEILYAPGETFAAGAAGRLSSSHPPPRAMHTLMMEVRWAARVLASWISASNRERSASSTSRYEA